ncbi:hypothetical protein ACWGJT_28700 [Streptomyces xantholiticus]
MAARPSPSGSPLHCPQPPPATWSRLAPAHAGARTTGDVFTSTSADFLVEALSGTTRHAVVTVTRVRQASSSLNRS